MITVVINGQSFDYPEVGDTDWGNAATVAFQSLCATTLQKSASSFTLENELDFGGSHGIKVLFISSRSNDPALSGVFRLANGELIAWRNEDNDGDNTISFDSDGDLIVNGTKVTLHGQIVNADIAAAAGIEESKLALDYSTDSLHTAIENHVTDTNNPHSVTKSQVLTGDLIVNSDVDAAAAIEESKLNLDYSTDSLNTAITTHVADTNNPHSVTKSQVLDNDLIVNADVDNSAAISESKLDLDYSTDSLNTAITSHTGNTSNPHSTSITNLTDTEISGVLSGDVLGFNGTKWVNQPSTSASLSGLSDTNITNPANGNTLVFNNVTTKWENSDKLSTVDTTLTSHIGNTSNPHSVTKSQVLSGNPIVNADVDASAAIAESKLSLDYSTSSLNTAVGNVAGDLSNHEGNTSNPHSTSVDNLTDSDIDSDTLTENDVMVFNDQTSKWENSQILVNHIGNASNPHLTTVSKLTDTTISSLTDKQLLQYDLANLQWVNSSDVWSTIEVNDIANINSATTNVTLTSSDKRHQIFSATDGFNITLPSTDVKAGEKFVFDWSDRAWMTTNTNPFIFKSSDSTILKYAWIPHFTYEFIALTNNPTSSSDWQFSTYRKMNSDSEAYIQAHAEPSISWTANNKADGNTGSVCSLFRGVWDLRYNFSIGVTGNPLTMCYFNTQGITPNNIIMNLDEDSGARFSMQYKANMPVSDSGDPASLYERNMVYSITYQTLGIRGRYYFGTSNTETRTLRYQLTCKLEAPITTNIT